jgi:YihY family inner membrane protein
VPDRIGGIDGLQRRHRVLGVPIAVVYKFFDDQGGYLAALITYYGFLSLFPLLLLLTTILGFVLHGHPNLQRDVVDSALSQFPVIGNELRGDVGHLQGNTTALVVGILAQALQNALDAVWAIPRRDRPNPFLSRLRSLGLLVLLGLGVLVTAGLTGITSGANIFGTDIGQWSRVLAGLLSIVGNTGLFLVAFTVLTAKRPSIRDVWVGSVAAAVGFQGLQTVGAWYLNHKLRGASQVYGTFGLVLGLLAWIYLEALIVVLAAEADAVRRRRLYPRALLTPFTDSVRLTEHDRRAYTSYAKISQFKSFQEVTVTFDRPPEEAGPEPGGPAPGWADGTALGGTEPDRADETEPDRADETEPERSEPERSEPERSEPGRVDGTDRTPGAPAAAGQAGSPELGGPGSGPDAGPDPYPSDAPPNRPRPAARSATSSHQKASPHIW